MIKHTTFLLAAISASAGTAKVDFTKDVEPILAQKCHSCHGPEAQQAGLRLDRRQNAMRGGDYGPVIVAGNSAASKLMKRVVSGDGGMQMPPTGALAPEEIAVLRAWIDQGAEFRLEVKEEAPPQPVDPKVAALLAAVRSEELKTVDPALVNARDQGGSTPLHHAAAFGSLKTMQLLLEQGAEVNAKNRRGATPLHWAIHDETKVRLLVERGAAVNTKQAEGRTPLYQAASIGNGLAVVKLLLEKGADVALAMATGQTPLMAAAGQGQVEVMKALLASKAKVDARSGTGATALMAAAAAGSADGVRLLLTHGADPNAMTKRKATALQNAATAGVDEAVKLLLAAGAKVNVQDDRGYSPLMFAAGSDTVPVGVVKMLLAAGADREATGEKETARSLAAKRGDTEVARLLGATFAKPVRTERAAANSISDAVQKAMGLLETQSHNFIRIGGCNSCHAQDLPSAAAALARERGLRAPATVAQLPESMRGVSPERILDLGAINVGSVAWELFDNGMNRLPRSAYTDAVVHYIKMMQTAAGHWHVTESRRPPMSAGEFQTAALAIYALQHYGPADAAVARATAWLETAKPANTQDWAFQLMGLVWAKANPAVVQSAARALATTQRADGGWSQLPAMHSDAYATGQAVYALRLAGKSSEKGVQYLLRTQALDGSWRVATRSIWFQPYFESGFPYGHDQWISAAGTAWASLALASAVEAPVVKSSAF